MKAKSPEEIQRYKIAKLQYLFNKAAYEAHVLTDIFVVLEDEGLELKEKVCVNLFLKEGPESCFAHLERTENINLNKILNDNSFEKITDYQSLLDFIRSYKID